MSITQPSRNDEVLERSRLPWRRRMVDAELLPLLQAYRARHPKASTERIEAAFEVASARCTYNALITPLLAEIEKVARQTS